MDIDFINFVKRRAITGLFSSPHFRDLLVLKGGNLLDVAYQIIARASIDLDFSIEGELPDVTRARDDFELALMAAFGPDGFQVIDVRICEKPPRLTEDLKEFWGGYDLEFKLVTIETFAKTASDVDSLRRRAIPLAAMGLRFFRWTSANTEYCSRQVVVFD